jgi:hypothetical protein
MRYILILSILLLSGCATTYYPNNDYGDRIKYKYTMAMVKCDRCHNETHLYKVINGKKIICNKCYRKLKKLD